MADLGFKEGAAINRIAAALAPSLSNGIIDSLAKELCSRPPRASNRTKKLQLMLAELLSDGRARTTATRAIYTLTMEAHHRTVAGNASMTTADADAIVTEMRVLGLPAADLARPGWRTGLKTPAAAAQTYGPIEQPSSPSPSVSTPRPRRHDDALTYIGQLAADNSRPQHRGRELEKVVFDVLLKEALQATGNIVNPGEQIDLAFVLDGQNYLVECKWEHDPTGLPHVSLFAAKIGTKAEGTFGVLVSMSGFVGNINETATRGTRLNCVGVGFRELIDILEGRTTFAAVVRASRSLASTRATFYAS